MPPVAPMLAKAVADVPDPAQPGALLYEPKWDGFRCIVFRDGDEVELGSRNERPLTRYFPDIVEAARRQLPERCVVDGEIIIAGPAGLDFEALLQRIHPAASRVNKLAAETPASFVAFDLLALGNEDYTSCPLGERRAALVEALRGAAPPVHLTPATDSPEVAREWFSTFEGAGLDGVVAKPTSEPYRPDVRAMLKVKHARTADCVVAGFRWHKSGPVVGSLLLGLYAETGVLLHVGVAASFTAKRRKELLDELAPYRLEDFSGHPWREWGSPSAQAPERMPGATSRWNAGKDLSWQPLRPELVVEVAYDHMEGTRFRHTAQFRRWRPERDPSSCTFTQLERAVHIGLTDVLNPSR